MGAYCQINIGNQKRNEVIMTVLKCVVKTYGFSYIKSVGVAFVLFCMINNLNALLYSCYKLYRLVVIVCTKTLTKKN